MKTFDDMWSLKQFEEKWKREERMTMEEKINLLKERERQVLEVMKKKHAEEKRHKHVRQ